HVHPVVHLRRHRRVHHRPGGADQARHPPPHICGSCGHSAPAARHTRRRLNKGRPPMSFNLRHRSFLKELDFTPAELKFLLGLSADLKAAKYGGYEVPRLTGKNVALIFEKTSTRTRTAFEVGAKDQGAHVTYLEPSGS